MAEKLNQESELETTAEVNKRYAEEPIYKGEKLPEPFIDPDGLYWASKEDYLKYLETINPETKVK